MSTKRVSFNAKRYTGYFENGRLVGNVNTAIDFGLSGKVVLSVNKGFGSTAFVVIKAKPSALMSIKAGIVPIVMSNEGFIPRSTKSDNQWAAVTFGPLATSEHKSYHHLYQVTGGGLVNSGTIKYHKGGFGSSDRYAIGNKGLTMHTIIENASIPDVLIIDDFIEEGYLVVRLKTEPVEYKVEGGIYQKKLVLFQGYPGITFNAKGIRIEEIFFLQ